MTDLPAVPTTPNSAPSVRGSLRAASTLDLIAACGPSTEDEGAHIAEIMARTESVLRLFYEPDLDAEARAEMQREFAAELANFPLWAIHRAFDRWRSQHKRRPSPAEIKILVTREIEPIGAELKRRREAEAPRLDADRQPISEEAATEIMARAGFTKDRFASARDNPMLGADLHLGEEDRERLEAERVARAARIRELSKPSEAQIERVRWSNPLMAEAMRAAGHRPSWESEHPSGEAA